MEQHKPNIENSEALYTLENFEHLSDGGKIDIIAVYKGLKPASIIGMHRGDSPEYIFENKVTEFQDTLHKLAIKFIITAADPKNEHIEFLIGKNDENLKELSNAYYSTFERTAEDYSPESFQKFQRTREQRIGYALGYPHTAVDAFVDPDQGSIEEDELPEEIQKSDELKFVNFILSRDHWQEELEYARQKAELVKEIAPEIYNRTVAKK